MPAKYDIDKMVFDLCDGDLTKWDYIWRNCDLVMAELASSFNRYDSCKEEEAMELNKKRG